VLHRKIRSPSTWGHTSSGIYQLRISNKIRDTGCCTDEPDARRRTFLELGDTCGVSDPHPLQVNNSRTAQPMAGRGLMPGRAARGGRNGGGRWTLGRTNGRGVDLSGSLGSYGMGGSTGGYDLGQGYGPSPVTQVEIPYHPGCSFLALIASH
jgi:hypothetical protein